MVVNIPDNPHHDQGLDGPYVNPVEVRRTDLTEPIGHTDFRDFVEYRIKIITERIRGLVRIRLKLEKFSDENVHV